ncbi:uncharacterized protein HMPREF1541_00394 [Cyphellophora europaea CBS 101466]|uniref:DNA replication regulator Sld3 C-terminal domain-containing protein n=1 Tax=Cyphellophora europaea (strain CBS 101466) TaxID=1220924 RepID=W2SC76_CYPE1|nr:uncharacterized protein HMPREF1541_00394 [Cyphellophora europaea CBS 101466]ETN46210.1 hypothetical protein HMPREF1541_00394 [Cyphellophora europaea CBS 101466]
MQAPPKRDPLVPASENQLNPKCMPDSPSRKRKRAFSDAQASKAASIAAKALSSNARPQSATFTVVATLARADLSLAWIDQSTTSSDLPPGYTFESSGPAFKNLAPKHVTIARLNPNGRLYAIERIQDRAFVAVLLHNWVCEESCRNAVSGNDEASKQQTMGPDRNENFRSHSRAGSSSSVRSVPLPVPRSPKKPANRKGALARMSILKSKDRAEEASPLDDTPVDIVQSPQELEGRMAGATAAFQESSNPEYLPALSLEQPSTTAVNQPNAVQDTPEPGNTFDIPPITQRFESGTVEHLRMQYLETLYLSRTSLAFYAKSSLVRARGLLKDPDLSITLNDLKEVYNSGMLTTRRMEKKYKETIPNMLKDLESPAAEEKQKRKKKSKPQAMKLGKNCLYSGEDELVRRWWDQREVSGNEEDREKRSKQRLTDLRVRETEMQVLLILEALTLDSITPNQALETAVHSGPKIKSEASDEAVIPRNTPVTKKAKAPNYLAELETLLDRLCIWHAVTLDDVLESPDKAHDGVDKGRDRLKEFCTDVVVPFYAPKVPTFVKVVCKKLGGPSISPQRPKQPRSNTSTRPSSSSGKGKSQPVVKMSLQRVLSEDQELRHATPPILSRSSSDKRKSSIKREPSEIMSRPSSRAGLQKSVSFNNREVDLAADARIQEAKRRKLERVGLQKKELAAAIEALKKPNRTSAAKEIVDEAEKRKAARDAVQITATPSKPRSHSFATAMSYAVEPKVVQAPVAPVIPSSTIKPASLTLPRSSATKRAVLDAIHDTPSRGDSRRSDPLNLGLPPASHSALVAATPSIRRTRSDLPVETPLQTSKMTKSGKAVLFTPLKRSDVTMEDVFKDAPEIPEKAGMAMDRVMGGKGVGDQLFSDSGIGSSGGRGTRMEQSLYAQLGWDEDFDDL